MGEVTSLGGPARKRKDLERVRKAKMDALGPDMRKDVDESSTAIIPSQTSEGGGKSMSAVGALLLENKSRIQKQNASSEKKIVSKITFGVAMRIQNQMNFLGSEIHVAGGKDEGRRFGGELLMRGGKPRGRGRHWWVREERGWMRRSAGGGEHSSTGKQIVLWGGDRVPKTSTLRSNLLWTKG